MPQQRVYEVTAPNGKTLEITGDRMPTEAELRDMFKAAGVDIGGPPRQPGLATIGDQVRAKNFIGGEAMFGSGPGEEPTRGAGAQVLPTAGGAIGGTIGAAYGPVGSI